MSDDFDKWFNDDEMPEEDDDLDLSDLDWLADDDDEPKSSNQERTGLTGQLDWQQATGEDGENIRDDDDDLADLDWLQEETGDGTPNRDDSRTGVTGMLDWSQDEQDGFEQQIDAAESAADDELPAWMQGVDDNLEGADGPTMPVQYDGPVPDYAAELDAGLGDDGEDDDLLDEIPDWMKPADDDDLYTEADIDDSPVEAEADAGDVPEWMQDTGTLYAPAEDETESAPDWMQNIGTGSLDDSPAVNEDEDEDGVPDWMQGIGVEEEDTFDDQPTATDQDDDGVPDWMQGIGVEEEDTFDDQPTATDQDDDGVPDWMQGIGVEEEDTFDDQPTATDQDDDVPDWMQGIGEEDTFDDQPTTAADQDDDVPDWMRGVEVEETGGIDEAPVDESDDEEIPAWMRDDAPAAEVEESEEEPLFMAEDADDLDDLFGDDADDLDELLTQSESPTSADFEDMFGEEDFDFEEEDDFDLLGELTDDDDDDLAALLGDDEAVDDFDLLGELTGGGDDDEPAAVAASDDDLDDLFGDEYDDDEPAAVAASDDDLDDLFGDEYDDDEPAAVAASDDDLDDLFGDEYDDEDDDEDIDSVLAAFDDDLDAMLGEDDEDVLPADDEPFDWFGAEESAEAPAPAASDDLDWLRDVEDYDETAEEAPPQAPAASVDEDEEYDLESFLSSFGEDRALAALPQTGELDQGDVDFDMLFGEDYDEQTDDEAAEDDTLIPLSPDAPDWLTDLSQESAGRESAASLVRGQRDRPVDELPDRLRALRERGMEFSPKTDALEADTGALDDVLQGVRNTLPAVVIEQGEASNIASNIAMTDEQSRHAAILQSIVGSSAADAEADTETQQQRHVRVTERALIAVILAVLVALPFFVDALQIGELPPPTFAAGTQERAFIDSIEAVPAGESVLVAVEYGPSGAAELDGATEALLMHLLNRGATPVIVGGNPVGMLRVQALMEDIASENALVANEDYVIGGYIVGDVVGLRRFNEYVDTLVGTDLNGDSTGFSVESLNDFALLVLVTETAERARLYGEQIRPDTIRPLIGITGQGAAPLTEPYVDGLLVGYEDAYTYRGLVQTLLAGGSIDVPLPTDTPEPTEEETPPVVEVTPEVTEAVTEDVTPEVTADAVVTAEVTAEVSEPTTTSTPMPTEPPAETPTPSMTVPPSETAPPTPTEEPIRVVVVTAAQAVNVRGGPSTLDPPVATLEPGAQALILGANDDESWYNILLEDTTEGWIAASVVRVEDFAAETPEAEPTNAATATPQPTIAAATPTPTTTPQPSQIGIGVVVADGAVNVRNGPATTNGVVGAALPGERLVILGANDDESWYNVELPDGTVGWIAAFLLQVELDGGEASKPRIVARQPIPPEATELPTEEVESPAEDITPDEVTDDAPTSTADLALRFPDRDADAYRDERWYSMTVGIIAAAVVIAGGTLINLLRALRRRRAQRE